jgi:dTDP-4-amino-4,6-dideoxygalactose transaminase
MLRYPPRLQTHLVSDLPTADALIDDLRRIDAARRYTNFGPLALEFETGLRQRLTASDPMPQQGAIHLTSLFSCYHALEIGLRLLGAAAGKTVLVPAVTFPACPLAVQHTGAAVLLADIDPATWVLTPAIARQIAAKTKIDIVMPVALYGVPLPTSDWDAFSRDTGIAVIFDAAAAVGTQSILEKGLVAQSLHATKPFGVGEGGILVSRDAGLIDRARIASNFGTVNRIAIDDGINAKLSEYHAAVGLAQLRRWDAIVARRGQLREQYQAALRPLAAHLSFQPGIDRAVVSCLMVKLAQPRAEKIVRLANEAGIGLHRTYLPPLYHHPHFASLPVVDATGRWVESPDLAVKTAHMTGSEDMTRHILGVPFHPFLVDGDIGAVVGLLSLLLDG